MTGSIMDFEIGDRVEMVNCLHCDDHLPCNGSAGTVLAVDKESFRIGVRWDKKMPFFHTLNQRCEPGYGWWVPPESCDVIEDDCDVTPQGSDALFAMLGL